MLEDLFHQALELDPAARSRFLDERCAADPRLRARLESLLTAWDGAGRFLSAQETPAETLIAPEPENRFVGWHVGPYHIRRLIAAGGMGSVFEAQQERPRRIVALKLMKSGIASRSALRRFEFEAQLLGRLRHPGIAQVYEAGTHVDSDGVLGPAGASVPFFAMEYIPGARAICDDARARSLDTRARLELFCKVCDAVHHGHSKGIIHRDLKPSNLLVDSSGQPKVIDFGVARSTDSDMALTTMQTSVGQLVGTLQYMSPEQCAADPHDLDIRTDVYSLGVVLYELLLGKLPYDVSAQPVYEATQTIRDRPPARPSSLNRTLRGDLETIVLKALEKDRGRRYQSAAALAEDIRRYLADEPISARPPSMMYHLRIFARRNRVLVGGAAATVLALILGLAGTATFAVHAQRQRRLADDRAQTLQREAYLSNLAAARAALVAHDSASAVTYLDACPPELRGWEWRWRRGLYSPPRNVIAVEPGFVCEGIAGNSIVLTDRKGTYILTDPHTGREISRVRLPVDSMRLFVLSPSGDAVLIDSDAGAAMYDLQTAGERWRRTDCGLGEGILRPFSSDGQRLVLPAPNSPRMFLLDAQTGRTVRTVDAGAVVRGASLNTDGRTVFVSTYGVDEIIDGAGGETLWRIDPALSGIFSPDGRQLLRFIAPSFIANELSIHDARTGRQFAGLNVRSGSARGAAYTPDSAVLATIEHFGEITLRDTSSFNPISVIRFASGVAPLYLAFTPDARSLINWQGADPIAAFSAMPDPNPVVISCRFLGEGPSRRRISADGRSVAVSDWGTMTVFDAVRGTARWTRCLGTRTYTPFAFSPHGLHVAAVSPGPCITLFETATGDPVATSDRLDCGPIDQLDWTPDREWLVAATEQNEIVILDGTTLRPVDGRAPDPASLSDVWLTETEEGILLCAAGGSLDALLPQPAAQTLTLERRALDGPAADLACIAVDGERRYLAAGTQAGRILVWDLHTGRRLADIAAADEPIAHLCFSRDASRLAAITRGRLVLVDPRQGKWVDALPANQREGRAIRFTHGDEALVISALGTPVIRFEITPPADIEREALLAAREVNRRAAAVIAALPDADRLILDDAIRRIEEKPELTAEVRQAAVAFARGLGEQPNWLNSNAWAIARDPGKSVEEYRKAARYVRAALAFLPDEFAYLNTLGAAQYRAGDFDDAITTMQQADLAWGRNDDEGARGPKPASGDRARDPQPASGDDTRESHPANGDGSRGSQPATSYDARGSHPANRVFIAMAHARLGRMTEARAELDLARALLQTPRFAADDEAARFVREAETLISP